MKKILISIISIGLLFGLVGIGTQAYFSDEKNSQGNIVQVGTWKTDQTITFANPGEVTFGIAPFALSASASSGLPVTFSVISGPAIWVDSKLTLTGAGIVIIKASQAGSGSYNAAPDVEQTINVAKATPTITWANPEDITVGTALSVTQLNAAASVEGSSVAGSFIYTPAAGTLLDVGAEQTLSVEFTPTDATNYNNTSATVTINVVLANSDAASSVATVSSAIYTVSAGGTVTETITNVPFGTAKATFLAALTKGETNQTWADTGIADMVVTGNTLVVTAQDGTTVVTYTVDVVESQN